MKNYAFILLFVAGLLLDYSVSNAQNPGKIQKLLARELELDKSEFELQACDLNTELAEKINAAYKLYVKGEHSGLVILANGMGRYDEFTFLVLTNPDKSTRLVRVVNYVSEYGGEIGSKKWLGQFVGYKGEALKYGDDIQAISGATYSASSITHRMTEIMELIQRTDF
ncbi:FMN-binding protein [Mangrovibacterium marinum]|uniref:FMN-binding protein n=1 Tax=Mangrovibacterium marinum TaxID=1639118 RepID=A0A2T5C1D7_9BACT|nr:FMN-binding protein [Mangrovibacterium marinum]PTN08471.1 hypothetical protein C8N47_10828 [Mangrovibacterium marinum]